MQYFLPLLLLNALLTFKSTLALILAFSDIKSKIRPYRSISFKSLEISSYFLEENLSKELNRPFNIRLTIIGTGILYLNYRKYIIFD